MSCAKRSGSLKTPRIPPWPATSRSPEELSTFLTHKQRHHYKKPQPVAAITLSPQLNQLCSAWSQNSPILVNFIIPNADPRPLRWPLLPRPSPNDLRSDYVRLAETNQRATSININEIKWIMLVTGDDSLTGAINTGAVRKLISFHLHSYWTHRRYTLPPPSSSRHACWSHWFNVAHVWSGREGGAVCFRARFHCHTRSVCVTAALDESCW